MMVMIITKANQNNKNKHKDDNSDIVDDNIHNQNSAYN